MQRKFVVYLDDSTLPDATQAVGKDIIAVVPAEEVLLTSASLPKMSRSRLTQALPYALEEQLISDVDTLHFATGEKQGDKLPVAVIAHEKIQRWLTQLQSSHFQADVLLPSSLLLPYEENTWHVFIHQMAIVRTNLLAGFACDKNNLPALLDLALTSAPHTPQRIYIHNYSSQPFAAALTEMGIEIKEDFFEPEEFIAHLTRGAEKLPPINLLQGPYKVKKSKFPQRQKISKALSYLAISWIILLFLYPVVSYFILKHRINYTDSQIQQIYKRNFPQANSIVAPKLRLQEKLQKLSAQVGEHRFLLLMGYLGKAMLETNNIKLKRLDFHNNELTLELMAPSSEDFAVFTDYLIQQGLNVKQQNATLMGTRINATVVIG